MSQQHDSDYESEGEQPALSGQVDSTRKKKVTVYKERQTIKRYEREKGRWARRDEENSEFKNVDYAGACKGMGIIIFGTANTMILAEGKGKSAEVAVSAKRVHCETHVNEKSGVKMVGAGAEAKEGNAAAGASITPIQAEAFAKASGAEAGAHAYLLEGITEANARAVAVEIKTNAGVGLKSLGAEAEASATGAKAEANAALIKEVVEAKASATAAEAQAKARVGLKDLGAYAGASATAVKVEAGVSNVPLAQASATGPEVKAEAGLSWKCLGASAGAYLGELKAGPLGVRAGVKYGATFRCGVPEVDAGPVTCSIM